MVMAPVAPVAVCMAESGSGTLWKSSFRHDSVTVFIRDEVAKVNRDVQHLCLGSR